MFSAFTSINGPIFWLLLAVPAVAFGSALFFGLWDDSDSQHEGPELDLDGEAGPPPGT